MLKVLSKDHAGQFHSDTDIKYLLTAKQNFMSGAEALCMLSEESSTISYALFPLFRFMTYLPEGELPIILTLHIGIENSISDCTERNDLCRRYLLQDGFLPLEESSSCLIAIRLNNYSPLRLRLDFYGDRCRFESAFEKIREPEG